MKRIVVTGIGTLNTAGCGVEQFWKALGDSNGKAAKPTWYDTTELTQQEVFEARELDKAGVVYRKGVSQGERGMHMAVAAAQLALGHSGHTEATLNHERTGVAFGAALDSMRALGAFHARTQAEGPRVADPGLFPNTGMSAAACQISIALGLRAFNATLSNGITSGLDAIGYGADMLRAGRADVVIAGGVYALSFETHLAFDLHWKHNGAGDGGMVLGEGAAALVLEEREAALARGATLLAEVKAHAAVFDPCRTLGYNPRATGASSAMGRALTKSSLAPEQIDLVLVNASGDRAADLMELRALRRIFGVGRVPQTAAVKAVCGETYSAAGAFQAAAAALSLAHGVAPRAGLRSSREPVSGGRTPQTALVNSFGTSGASTSLVLSRC